MFSPLQWSTEVSSGASHVCTDPTRSSWFLKDFSDSKLKICFLFSLTAVQSSPWSVYMLCPFKCRGHNLQSSFLFKAYLENDGCFFIASKHAKYINYYFCKVLFEFLLYTLKPGCLDLITKPKFDAQYFRWRRHSTTSILEKRLYSIDMLKQWFLCGRENTQMGLLQENLSETQINWNCQRRYQERRAPVTWAARCGSCTGMLTIIMTKSEQQKIMKLFNTKV